MQLKLLGTPVTITATSKANNNLTKTVTVTVKASLIGITLDKPELEIYKGKTENLTVNYNPTNTTDEKTVTWTSSNPNVATVDENGTVTAVAAGKANITATVGNKTTVSKVTVKENKIKAIAINGENLELNVNETQQLNVSYTFEEPEKETTDSKNVTWTSNNTDVAIVDENGTVTAIAGGKAIITANVNGIIATKEVNVKVPLTKIEVSSIDNTTTLVKGQSTTLKVVYTPENTTDEKTVVWSSDNEAVEVKDGIVTAKEAVDGTVKITVKSTVNNEIKAEYVLTVTEIEAGEIEIDNKTLELYVNENKTLSIISDSEEAIQNIEWTSSNPNVATVDENGTVTAIAVGTAEITANVGSKTSVCTLNVKENQITEIAIDSEDVELYTGKTKKLEIKYTLEKEGIDTTVSKNVTWTSNNTNIATVDENGIVTAIAEGTADITAKLGNKTSTIRVTVKIDNSSNNSGTTSSSGNGTWSSSSNDSSEDNQGTSKEDGKDNTQNTKVQEKSTDIISGKTVIPTVLQSETDKLTGKDLIEANKNAEITVNGTKMQEDTLLKTGDVVSINGEESTIVIYGDTNSDGGIDIFDAIEMIRQIKKAIEMKEPNFVAADLDKNGDIDIFDVIDLLSVITKHVSYENIVK